MTDDGKSPVLPLPVVLIGPPAAGKSTVGRALAHALGARFIDVDDEIARAARASIETIFAREGEGGFRVWEHRALARALDDEGPLVIALGAGGHVPHANARLLRHRAFSVLLDVDQACALARLGDAGTRPLLAGDVRARLAALEEGRAHARRALARAVVDGSAPVAHVVQAVIEKLSAPLARAILLPEPDDDVPDDVVMDDVSRGLESVRARIGARTLVAIVDENVRHRIDESAFARVLAVDAAQVKTAAAALGLTESLVGLPKDALLVGIGGGSVLDATGFIAHIVRRGVAHVLVPTTLLAMVDAAHGGKTALDHVHARNAIGAFHPPRAVVVDVRFLEDESPDQRRSGAAEMLKAEFLRTDGPHDGSADDDDRAIRTLIDGTATRSERERAIARAVLLKRAIVDIDPFDRGPRLALNLGHTIGHAIEAATGFSIAHGEGVRRGLLGALALSERRAGLDALVAARMRSRVHALAPDTLAPSLRTDLRSDVMSALLFDKKRSAHGVRFVLLSAKGAICLDEPPPDDVADAVAHALDAV
jgi:shikimate kinase/3-dehydroquinate synthase